ncbi:MULTISPECIES: TetR/AcrR family transcriptional regulator [Brevibacillus]|jgi:AcrR family transcriptional regulator|uniref:Transcriptional regulator n=1 Tax=Brevibacillus borstelensis AK1 TaxID=1300222 RepID=M8EEK6_9BACL|nr:TetR/AcrR family transcriptional regulator [Brevibacillus borstelensis]EMT53920.1 transcriptional regulator [Brevibacillus borstelensis AK1]KKX56685.1 transcriptional regulator [Brevibacillus borstelensis cifa_chp40]MBE5395629.1 TetR/AcrR family transcriptional regulator [Brevibacillus borstelensis]MCC0565310.1 TetR/AcrR family transcriptional regulator [Brevibacillus borstelensis]MCM3470835.1 TetR/AcrR family transcriptional regulator [Brevibacillus borstelensis]
MARSKKDQIVEAALTAFAQYGYSDTTMDAIADVAAVAKGTLYYHFSTKEELFLYVIEKGVKMLIDSVDSVMQREDLSMDQRVLCVLDEHLRFFSEHRELCLLLLSFFTGDQQRDEMIGKLLSGYFMAMEAYVAELQQEGFVRPDIEVRTMVSSLFGMAGFTMLRKQFRKETGITDSDRRTLHMLLSGVLMKG